jgi:hypothetical protein
VILEPVDRAARYAKGFAGVNVERPTVNRPPESLPSKLG